MEQSVHFLEKQAEFDQVMARLSGHEWIGFDTEFVGEKTYIPILCLLQIVAGPDIYLVDTLQVKDLTAFLTIVADPAVLKITHAGDNDYRLLHTLYGTVPANTFDTQIAAGFVGYNYPAGFGKIVEKELGILLAKSHTVANWEARPIEPKALNYAVEDVKFLPALHEQLTKKLRRKHREAWQQEENRKWEAPEFYLVDPNKELLANDFIHSLDGREKVFLLRLYRWRRERAISLNIPKETALQARFIGSIVRGIKDGQQSLRSNRTLPENVWRKHLDEWQKLWKTPATEEETQFLRSIPRPAPDNPDHEWTMELLYHFVKKQCLEHEISAALLLPKGDFNRLKSGSDDFDHDLLTGWRAELLGSELVAWMQKGKKIKVHWQPGECRLTM